MDKNTFKRNLSGLSVMAMVGALKLGRQQEKTNLTLMHHSVKKHTHRISRKFWPQLRRRHATGFSDHELMVNSLTNHERTLWAREGKHNEFGERIPNSGYRQNVLKRMVG